MQREYMEYDVVVVGAGPAGLATAIHLKQQAVAQEKELSVCVLEKGSEVGAHILSGALLDPCALDELFSDWRERHAPVQTPAQTDSFLYLTESVAVSLPAPPQMRNHGNFIISLGNLCRWLAEQAEMLGVEIYPGFAATEVLLHEDGSVKGIATGDMGGLSDGSQGSDYQPGMELWARQTVFAEGCRGSLSQQIIQQFQLDRHSDPQSYGIGIKEIWEVLPAQHQPGKVVHSIGWPLDSDTYGGSFIYHLENNQVAVGFVIGLDYSNPYLSPFEEFQRFKTHPAIRDTFIGGRRIAYGARALSEGGIQSLPELTFPGGVIVGDSAGFLNVPRIKGIHCAIKSGMLAAEAIYGLLIDDSSRNQATAYQENFRHSWLYKELWQARNIRPSFRWGLLPALVYSALDTYILRGNAPWTLHHRKTDYQSLRPASDFFQIEYPKPDGTLTFDRLSSVYLANVQHREDQPVHLTLKDVAIPVQINLSEYDAPEQRYCPAQVYEIVYEDGVPQLQINAQNCVHCKTCDIKDPTQNIVWIPPEGGSGPHYPNM